MNAEPSPEYRYVHPKRLMMWLYLASTLMIFAGLTSAIIVSYADWERKPVGWATDYDLPPAFNFTTVLVVLSSFSLQWAFAAAKRNRNSQTTIGLIFTLGLGVAFLFGQFIGFQEMVAQGAYLVGEANPSAAFVYVVTSLHAIHLVAAIIVMIALSIKALQHRILPEKLLSFELAATFWHALGVLWLYLFVFLSYIYN